MCTVSAIASALHIHKLTGKAGHYWRLRHTSPIGFVPPVLQRGGRQHGAAKASPAAALFWLSGRGLIA